MKVSSALHPTLIKHIAAWENCEKCSLFECRKNVCTYAGRLPAKVLFIAKSPSGEADIYGYPYPAPGDVFHQIAEAAGSNWCATYLASCGGSSEPITKDHFERCWPKVLELMQMARPKIIITMGNDPYSFMISKIGKVIESLKYRPALIRIVDPFWITTQKDPMQHIQNSKLTVEQVITKYIKAPK